MSFLRPELWTWVLVGVLVSLLLLSFDVIRNRVWILRLGGRKRLISQGSRIPRFTRDVSWVLVLTAAIALLGVAVLEPVQRTLTKVPVYDKAVIVIAVDASRSALAEDVITEDGRKISRLEFEKIIVRRLAPHMREDLVGMIFFAETAISVETVLLSGSEQELLYSLIRFYDEYFVEYEIPQGSNIASAVKRAVELSGKTAKKKIFVFLSDGEDTGGKEEQDKIFSAAKKSLDEFKTQGNSVSFILAGVGDVSKGSPMPKRSFYGEIIGCYEEEKGKCRLTRPNGEFLGNMANYFGGDYIHVRNPEDIEKRLLPLLSSSKTTIGWETKEAIEDKSWLFVLLAYVLFLISPFLRVP